MNLDELASTQFVGSSNAEEVFGVGQQVGDFGGQLGGVLDHDFVVPHGSVQAGLDDVGGDGAAAVVGRRFPGHFHVLSKDTGDGGWLHHAWGGADGGGVDGHCGGQAPARGVPAGQQEVVLGGGGQVGDGVLVGVAQEDALVARLG